MKNWYNEDIFEKDVIELLKKQGFSYLTSSEIKKYRIGNDKVFDVKKFLLKEIIR